jgi:Glycosyltransferase family 87
MRGMVRAGNGIGARLRELGAPWEVACFAWLPAIVLGVVAWLESRPGLPVGDYRIFRTAALAVLHGKTPYPPATVHALSHFDAFVYPPVSALLFAPAAALPLAAGRVLILVLSVLSVLLALRLLDVRDWRCYGVALVSAPMVNSFTLGAITPFLLVGTAATWRYRDRSAAAGAAAALSLVAKLFLWPLAVWLVVRRRLRAAVAFAAVSVLTAVGGWALIGFAGLGSYPHLLRVLSRLEAPVGYSPVTLLARGAAGSVWLAVLLSAAVVVAVVIAARGPDGDRRAFAIAVVGSLVATPIIWLHYFVLLLVPVALYRPRLSPLWFAPLLLWATPETHANGAAWKVVLALAVTGLALVPAVAESAPKRLRPRPGRPGDNLSAVQGLVRGAEPT